ncbi:MAG TPA: response regulator [Terriglobales bacterium]|nr:response regulator [Terriglobales bacterium]
MPNETQDSQPQTRVLFVDDERAIRLTLPAILEQHGFDVVVAGSVPEALDNINHQSFDVLLTDLNIGSPADGFILVSAMRRIQPSAATFILTGYPDFQTALEAIRKQVDDYFTKPADIPTLVSTLKEKVHHPRCSEPPCKRVSTVISEKSDEIIERWLQEVSADERWSSISLSKEERIDRLPLLLTDLAKAVEAGKAEIPAELLSAAAAHGADRCRHCYTIPLLVTETRILNRVIATVLQEDLLSMNLSMLIPDALKTGEYLETLLEESIRAFQAAQVNPHIAASRPPQLEGIRRTRAKAS